MDLRLLRLSYSCPLPVFAQRIVAPSSIIPFQGFALARLSEAAAAATNACSALPASPPLLSLLGFSALLQWMLSAVRSPNWSHWGRPALLTLRFLTPLWFPILVPVPTLTPLLPTYLLDKCERKVLGRWRRRKDLLKSQMQHLYTSVCMLCCLRVRGNLTLFDSSSV